jgi:hypothetical protein
MCSKWHYIHVQYSQTSMSTYNPHNIFVLQISQNMSYAETCMTNIYTKISMPNSKSMNVTKKCLTHHRCM